MRRNRTDSVFREIPRRLGWLEVTGVGRRRQRARCFKLCSDIQDPRPGPFQRAKGRKTIPDPADTNGDGVVSAAEKLIYDFTHPTATADSSK